MGAKNRNTRHESGDDSKLLGNAAPFIVMKALKKRPHNNPKLPRFEVAESW